MRKVSRFSKKKEIKTYLLLLRYFSLVRLKTQTSTIYVERGPARKKHPARYMDGHGELSAAVRWRERWAAGAAGRGGGRWAEATWLGASSFVVVAAKNGCVKMCGNWGRKIPPKRMLTRLNPYTNPTQVLFGLHEHLHRSDLGVQLWSPSLQPSSQPSSQPLSQPYLQSLSHSLTQPSAQPPSQPIHLSSRQPSVGSATHI